MENAQLIGLSRQIALQRQMDVVANNIANINTTGFKSEQLLFEEFVMRGASDGDFAAPDRSPSFTQDWTTVHDLSAGALTQTGNPLDVALQGDGFLVVQTPGGERWTRSGSLAIDATGTLVDLNGNPVLGDGGPIQFGAGETDVMIADDGTVSSSGGLRGRLRLVEFDDVQQTERLGNNLFAGGTPVPATATRVVQGSIERSNVSGIAEMSELIRVQRSYESIAGLLSKQDEQRRSAIQKLGSLNA